MIPNNARTNNSQSAVSRQSNTSHSLDVKFNMAKHQCSCHSTTPTTSKDSVDSVIDVQKQIYEEEELIRQKLSVRSYHLPGNTWIQDLTMYIRNNHLVFGLCCRHRLHPVTTKHRLIILLGSLAFGLTVTNAVYLYYLFTETRNYDDTAFALSISLSGEMVDGLSTQKNVSLDVSNGMLALWTLGAGAHAMFDLLLWHMIACGYCRKRKLGQAGWNVSVALVSISVAMASFVVLYRAYKVEESNLEAHLLQLQLMDDTNSTVGLQFVDDYNSTVSVDDLTPNVPADGQSPRRPISIGTLFSLGEKKPDFHFLTGYLVELFASLFVFTPLIQFILFTGILGCCGRLPLVGGRPRSVALEKERVRKLARKQSPV